MALEEKVLLDGRVRKREKYTSKEIAQIRRVIISILPRVKITHLNWDANSATTVCSETLRLTGCPMKVEEKWWKGSVALLKELIQMCPKITFRKSLFYGTAKNRSNRTVTFSRGHVAPHTNSGKGPSQGVIQRCELQETRSCAPRFWWVDTSGNLAPRTMRPQRSMGFGEKCLSAQNKGQVRRLKGGARPWGFSFFF